MERSRQQGSKQKERLSKHITRLQAAIRRKYRNFKQGNVESERLLEQQYKPLISELKKNNERGRSLANVKKEEEKEYESNADEDMSENSNEEPEFKPQIYSSPKIPSPVVLPLQSNELYESPAHNQEENYSDITNAVSTSKGFENASHFINENFTNELSKKYMMKLMKDISGRKQKIDHTFGPRYEDKTLMVGNKQLQFDDDGSIRLGQVSYAPSEGLYELVFKRIPDDKIYSENDLIAYKDILTKTSAHKVGYKYSGRINRDNSLKYKNVISHLFPKSLYSGKGRAALLDKGIKSVSQSDIVYWNDPNELCDRLRLLVTSAETGNTNHRNEIISIVEELIESKYISGSGNSRFLSLIK